MKGDQIKGQPRRAGTHHLSTPVAPFLMVLASGQKSTEPIRQGRVRHAPSSNHRIHETSSASCAPNSRWICTIQEIDSAEMRTSRYGPASQQQGDQHHSSHCEARGLRAAQEGSLISLLMKSSAPRPAPITGVAAGHGGLFALGGPPAAGFGCCWGAVLVKAEHLQGAKHDDLTVVSPKTTRR